MKKHRIAVKRALVFFVCLASLSLLMCACQAEQNAVDKTETPPWKTAYLDFLETEKDTHLSYALVFVDDDDIPELYLSGNCEAVGDSVCSYKNGTVVRQELHRIGGGWYVENSGNVMNQNGHMGEKLTHVYKLGKNGFELTFKARSVEHVELSDEDKAKIYYEYSIGDAPANETDYKAAVEAAFDFENAVRLNENSVGYDSIRQQITAFE